MKKQIDAMIEEIIEDAPIHTIKEINPYGRHNDVELTRAADSYINSQKEALSKKSVNWLVEELERRGYHNMAIVIRQR